MMNEVRCWCCAGEAWLGAAAHSPSQRLVRPYRPGRAAEEPLERFLNRITAAVLTAQDVTDSIVLSGKDGKDAKPYQEKKVMDALQTLDKIQQGEK